MTVTEQIRKKVGALPHKPGIYLMRDRFGTVIYVGKARDLRKRVSQYFQPSRRLGWDLKFQALVEAIHDFDYHTVRSEPEALLLEGKLIKDFHPRYNVSFRDDKRFLMLKVNLKDPIPRFTLTRLRQDDGARYFGPFPNSSALRSTLALVRRQFHLRGCRPLTPGENDYKHCLYAHLKYCTAPCINNVIREQYLEQVQAACDFLDGQCQEMQEQLAAQMGRAAAAQEYERAAELRDLLADLRRTTQKVNRFERVPYSLPQAIDPQRDLAELAEVLGLAAPPERIEGFDISNISGTFKVASLVSFRAGRPDRANYRRFRIKTVEGQDDFASVAEVVRRRYTRVLNELRGPVRAEGEKRQQAAAPQSAEAHPLPGAAMSDFQSVSPFPGEARRGADGPGVGVHGRGDIPTDSAAAREARWEGGEPVPKELQQLANETGAAVRRGQPVRKPRPAPALPDLILIDGGKGQLSAACAELEKLGLGRIPIIGLAKEFEEIYRTGAKEPLRLPAQSGALKLLQRVRDESHRLANTYNAELRLRKISESILDEFPNIGQRRKAALLKKFGSVQRMRAASAEELAQVPGFGGKAATELKAFLAARQ
jgi:excinuclease ABC subunit C